MLGGAIWGFWHTLLWFLSSVYAGLELLYHIACFLLGTVALSLIIGVCYNRCNDLVVPVWIHFVFNFVLTACAGTLMDMMPLFTLLYALVAIGYGVWRRQKSDANLGWVRVR